MLQMLQMYHLNVTNVTNDEKLNKLYHLNVKLYHLSVKLINRLMKIQNVRFSEKSDISYLNQHSPKKEHVSTFNTSLRCRDLLVRHSKP
jgi:hypothetical protein